MFVERKCSRFIMMAVCALPLLAAAAPRYGIIELGGAGSAAHAINASGQVAGAFISNGGDQHAFVHSGISLLDLGTLGGTTSWASAINNNGQVAGVATNVAGEQRAFSYALATMSDLGTFGGDASRVYGMNDAGTIVGGARYADGLSGDFGMIAFVYANGSMQDIGTLPVGPDYFQFSRALDINALGQVVGTSSFGNTGPTEFPEHAFLYDNGSMSDLGTLGGIYSYARAINDGGLIVGQASTDLDPDNVGHTLPHAFMYINGMMIDLGALAGPLFISDALDVNNLGDVVGWSGTAGDAHAFLYQGGSLLDVNDLIDPLSGWTVTQAAAINDLGQIAGTACHDGQCHAVRLDLLPAEVPEPGAWLLMATGLGMMGWVSTRRRSRRS